jgi:hypothetical protein
VGAVAQQPSDRRQRRESEPQPHWSTQRLRLPAVRRGDHRPLQHVADAAEVVTAVAGQAKGCFRELLLQHAWPEFHQQVGLDGSSVPQAVRRSRWDSELLARLELEPGPVDGKRCRSCQHRKPRFLDGVDVGIADTAAGREPGLVLDELAVGFRGSL